MTSGLDGFTPLPAGQEVQPGWKKTSVKTKAQTGLEGIALLQGAWHHSGGQAAENSAACTAIAHLDAVDR